MKMRKINNDRGLTLLELLVVLAVIGIVATFTIPNITKFASARIAENDLATIRSLIDYSKTASYSKGKTMVILQTNQNTILWGLMAVIALLSGVFVWLFPTVESQIVFVIWVLFSTFYSVRPLRFKARLLLDSWSNVLYILPGIMVYLIFEPLANLSWPLVVAAWVWAMGMHLFSALPDIKSDRSAKVKTTAVWLGFKKATLLTLAYYSTAAILCGIYANIWLGVLALLCYCIYNCFIFKSPEGFISIKIKKFIYFCA